MGICTVEAISPEQLYARMSGSEKAALVQHTQAGLQHVAFNGYYGYVFGDGRILEKVQSMIKTEFAGQKGFSRANH